MTTTTRKLTSANTISATAIERRYQQAMPQGHFFDASTKRYFGARTCQGFVGAREVVYFVTSEQFVDSLGNAHPRAYTVRILDSRTGEISEDSQDFQGYPTRAKAMASAKRQAEASLEAYALEQQYGAGVEIDLTDAMIEILSGCFDLSPALRTWVDSLPAARDTVVRISPKLAETALYYTAKLGNAGLHRAMGVAAVAAPTGDAPTTEERDLWRDAQRAAAATIALDREARDQHGDTLIAWTQVAEALVEEHGEELARAIARHLRDDALAGAYGNAAYRWAQVVFLVGEVGEPTPPSDDTDRGLNVRADGGYESPDGEIVYDVAPQTPPADPCEAVGCDATQLTGDIYCRPHSDHAALYGDLDLMSPEARREFRAELRADRAEVTPSGCRVCDEGERLEGREVCEDCLQYVNDSSVLKRYGVTGQASLATTTTIGTGSIGRQLSATTVDAYSHREAVRKALQFYRETGAVSGRWQVEVDVVELEVVEPEPDTRTVYRVIDTRTGQQVGSDYTDASRARRRADKLDLDYGAVRYTVRREEQAFAVSDAHHEVLEPTPEAVSMVMTAAAESHPHPRPYRITLSDDDLNALDWLANRYQWAQVLRAVLGDAEGEDDPAETSPWVYCLRESDVWLFTEAVEAEDGYLTCAGGTLFDAVHGLLQEVV